MNRIIAGLVVFAGLLALPAVASAEPQYVYVRYGGDRPYLYVTSEPRPALPEYVRADGLRFDSEVGAACGTLRTDLFFAPSDIGLDAYDRSVLSSLAACMTRGNLSGAKVELVAGHDGTYSSSQRAQVRLAEVIEYLRFQGVTASQLTYSLDLAPGWQADRLRFRFAEPVAWPYVIQR